MSSLPPPRALSDTLIDDLINRAGLNPRRRQHLNVHASYADPCQRFFNAVCEGSYIQPHRHSATSGEETLLAIRGEFLAVFFDDEGSIDQVLRCGNGENIGSVVPPGRWHTVIALTPVAVMIEIKSGPFDPDQAKEFAPWAPMAGDQNERDYHDDLLRASMLWQTNINA